MKFHHIGGSLCFMKETNESSNDIGTKNHVQLGMKRVVSEGGEVASAQWGRLGDIREAVVQRSQCDS